MMIKTQIILIKVMSKETPEKEVVIEVVETQ